MPLRHEMDAYPGEPTACFSRFTSLDHDGVEMWDVRLFSQLGTHVDAPSHFVHGGHAVDRIELSACVGPAVVVDVGEHQVRSDDGVEFAAEPFLAAEERIRESRRVLVRSGWYHRYGGNGFWTEYPQLPLSVAELLVSWDVRFVGLDTPSPHRRLQHEVHGTLLKSGVVLAECLTNLDAVGDGDVLLVCLPLPLVGLDGSPARAIALIGEA